MLATDLMRSIRGDCRFINSKTHFAICLHRLSENLTELSQSYCIYVTHSNLSGGLVK